MFWPFDPAKNAIQGDAPEGGDTLQWQLVERKSRGRKLADEMGQGNSHGTLQSDAPEESDLWTAWQLFTLDDD